VDDDVLDCLLGFCTTRCGDGGFFDIGVVVSLGIGVPRGYARDIAQFR
jgi:hypothetical protein